MEITSDKTLTVNNLNSRKCAKCHNVCWLCVRVWECGCLCGCVFVGVSACAFYFNPSAHLRYQNSCFSALESLED